MKTQANVTEVTIGDSLIMMTHVKDAVQIVGTARKSICLWHLKKRGKTLMITENT